jgi:hypothetical protein
MMILAEVVFLTRFLGLVAGEQPVRLKVDPDVRQVEIRRDGATIATLRGPRWGATIDFGKELTPHELSAVGLNAQGEEVGRDTQIVNLARPLAEIGILLERNPAGALTARLQWGHVLGQSPVSAILKYDQSVVSRSTSGSAVLLPASVDRDAVHVVSAEMEFADGVRAQKEVVFGGMFSEQMPAELTAVAVRQRGERTEPAPCFTTRGKAVAPTAVERGNGTAYFVFNGAVGSARRELASTRQPESKFTLPDAELRIVAPVPQRVKTSGDSETEIFPSFPASGDRGTRKLLLREGKRPGGQAQVADAVATAALRALTGERRRVIVVVVGQNAAPDKSAHSGASVRRYLERIGVPLRIWSLTGPNEALAKEWGSVQDVSTMDGLVAATAELRRELETQRIAWLPLAPLDAFRVASSASCSYEPLAHID